MTDRLPDDRRRQRSNPNRLRHLAVHLSRVEVAPPVPAGVVRLVPRSSWPTATVRAVDAVSNLTADLMTAVQQLSGHVAADDFTRDEPPHIRVYPVHGWRRWGIMAAATRFAGDQRTRRGADG